MKRDEFLKDLKKKLAGLPQEDINNRVDFYNEMIDDLCEDGLSEEEAIEKLGPVDDFVKKVANETPLINIVKEKAKPKRSLHGWEIALLVLGFPLWFPLLITFLCLCLVAYILLWVLVIVTYSVTISIITGTISGAVLAISGLSTGYMAAAGFYIGFTIAGIGLTILLFYACKYATIFSFKLAKKIILKIKLSFKKSSIFILS